MKDHPIVGAASTSRGTSNGSRHPSDQCQPEGLRYRDIRATSHVILQNAM